MDKLGILKRKQSNEREEGETAVGGNINFLLHV